MENLDLEIQQNFIGREDSIKFLRKMFHDFGKKSFTTVLTTPTGGFFKVIGGFDKVQLSVVPKTIFVGFRLSQVTLYFPFNI